MSKINGYSLLSTSSEYDEREQIKSSESLNNFRTNLISSKNSNSLNLLENIINYGYNPLLTPTALGLGLLCNKIKKDKNKVLLTGIGGDELFCGYYVNFLSHILSFKNKKQFKEKFLFWKNNIKMFIRNPNLKDFKIAGKPKNKDRLNFFVEGRSVLDNYIKKNQKIKIKKCTMMYFTIICYKTFFSKYTISSFSIRLCLHVFFIRKQKSIFIKKFI